MIDQKFAILGALISISGSATYAWRTVHGQTQPNRVSWGLWTVAPLIAFAAELAQHVGLQALLTFAVGFGPLLVVLASFADPKAYARITRADAACAALSLAALAGWAATGTGDVAISLSILSDLFGAIPTVRKAYSRPETESASAFLGSGAGTTITLLTIPAGHWTFARFGFPLYILLADVTLSALILSPRRRYRAPDAGSPAK